MPAPGSTGAALLIALIGLPFAIVLFFVLSNDLGQDFLTFGVMAICFAGLATIFLLTSGSLNAQWCAAPGFMTLITLLEFVAIPFSRFINGDDLIDSYYLEAMGFLLIGFSVFWLTCWLLRKPYVFAFVPELPTGKPRVVVLATIMFAVGFMAKVALWKLGVIGYEAATLRYTADVSFVGSINIVGTSLGLSMIIFGIEIFGKGSRSLFIRGMFGLSVAAALGFGLISGMKAEFLGPLFALVILLGVTRGKFPKLAWSLPIFYLLLQPFVLAYRLNLNAGYAAQINTVGGLTSTLGKTFEDVFSGDTHPLGTHRSYFDTAGSRLSELALFHKVLQLPSPDLLNGDEKVWLAPVYPFIPRALWKDKPVFDKAIRMSEALGLGRGTATNIPGIADLYALGGFLGIVVGMAIWGACLQLYMNSVKYGLSEKGAFLYVVILLAIANIERDIVAMIGGAVESICVYLILAKLVYGGKLFSMKAAR